MENRRAILTEDDHANMLVFFGHILEKFKDGILSKADAENHIAHTMTALDIGNIGEVRSSFKSSPSYKTDESGEGKKRVTEDIRRGSRMSNGKLPK